MYKKQSSHEKCYLISVPYGKINILTKHVGHANCKHSQKIVQRNYKRQWGPPPPTKINKITIELNIRIVLLKMHKLADKLTRFMPYYVNIA